MANHFPSWISRPPKTSECLTPSQFPTSQILVQILRKGHYITRPYLSSNSIAPLLISRTSLFSSYHRYANTAQTNTQNFKQKLISPKSQTKQILQPHSTITRRPPYRIRGNNIQSTIYLNHASFHRWTSQKEMINFITSSKP